MYLLERLLGIATYLIVLLIVCNGISVSKSLTSVRRWLIAFAAVLGVMGFFYVPAPQADLYRLLDYMHNWAANDVAWLINYLPTTSTPMWTAYFWAIGQFRIDGLLPGITGFLYFMLIFSCVWSYDAKEGAQPKTVVWSVLFFMSFGTFLEAVSGIRSALTFAIFFWCIYREVVLAKSPFAHLPAYVFAALMHQVGMAILLFRFVVLALQKNESKFGRFFSCAISLAALSFVVYYGRSYIEGMFDKIETYVTYDVYSNMWEIILHLILILAAFLTIMQQRKLVVEPAERTVLRNLGIIEALLVAISLVGLVLNYAIFHRFSSFLGMFAAISFMAVQMHADKNSKSYASYMTAMQLCTVFMLVLACARGNLCAYKFFSLE